MIKSGDSYYIDSVVFFCEEDGHQECSEYIQKLGQSYEEHIVFLLEAGALSIDYDLVIYEYAFLCLQEIKRKNPRFYIGAFSRFGENDLNADLLKED